MIHDLLLRQLRRAGLAGSEFEEQTPVGSLLRQVNLAYNRHDGDRSRLERSLDVSSREMLERTQEIKHQAFHDKLTGLPNRALFHDRMELALAKGKWAGTTTTLFFLDLDTFKLINDSFGHDAGDIVLCETARRLSAVVRPGDTVARLGGDEFTVIVESPGGTEEVRKIAEAIHAVLKEPFLIGPREVFSTASIGVASGISGAVAADVAIKRADTAMYKAKELGGSQFVFYDDSMFEDSLDRLAMETALRKALGLGQIRAAYQPIVDIKTGAFIGAEALARWDLPERGEIPPSVFIPIAESIGVIVPIGNFILEEACRQANEWLSDIGEARFTMSVNLSFKQVESLDLVEAVRAVLTKTGLPPDRLQLELTESTLMSDQRAMAEKLLALKSLGVRLAIDDFGTGYSSLAVLTSLPIDTLKIDRSFISGLPDAGRPKAIVASIVAMAKAMKLDLVGEGIESEEQREIVESMGCSTGQGYLFDQPLAPSDFLASLHAGGFQPGQQAA